jgi:hypothetical protein
VRRAANDTIRFALPAVARRCVGRRALLLESEDFRGNGVLVLLLHGDSSAPPRGSYPVTLLGDSTTPRGANVSVRYMIRDVAFGYPLDRGTVELTAARGSFTARVTGEGIEAAAPVSLAADFDRVRLAADSVPCRYQL